MKERLISAVIALIICIPLVLIGGLPFKIGVSILSVIGLFELFRCLDKKCEYPKIIKLLSYLLLILFLMIDYSIIIKILIIFLILSIPIIFIEREKYNIESFLCLFSSVTFLGLVFNYFILIRISDIYLFIYLFLVTILTDTFAYLIGKAIGKHKLIPSVSPKKTIEGSFAGSLVGTIIPAIFYLYMVDPGANFLIVILMTLLLSVLGQLGDLFFSSIKRFYNIKDFSNLMPGHGGVLDRLDSIIFAVIGYIIFINLI